MLRARVAQQVSVRVEGMPEVVVRARKVWPLLRILALLLCATFLLVQLFPTTDFRHPKGTISSWMPGHVVAGDLQLGQESAHQSGLDGKVRTEAGAQGAGWQEKHAHGVVEEDASENSLDRGVHIFLSTDEPDLRPLAVLINSTIVNARRPERIFFHLIVPLLEQHWSQLKALFPEVHLEISRKNLDLERLQNLIAFRNDSKTREELTSPYNFIPFYLPQLYGHLSRIVYLDTDIVVQGDVEELITLNLHGHAVAAVEDCMQHFHIYFNAKLLEKIRAKYASLHPWLPEDSFDLTTCVFNRGVLVLDTQEWRKQKLTEAIEWWMVEYAKSEDPLYSYGLSQPPFLLSVYRDYKKLDVTWNTRGLGRDKFSELERDYMQKLLSKRPKKNPFISPHADFAKILHFNGKFKPWKRERIRLADESVISLCGHVECADIWWSYLSPAANIQLRSDESGST